MSNSFIDNQLLASLPSASMEKLGSDLVNVVLLQNTVLYEAGSPVEQVYFPTSGMVSLLAVMHDGRAVETATIGREGVVGAMAGFGPYNSFVRATIQLPGIMLRISASNFQAAVKSDPTLQTMCMNYNEVLLSQARVIAACNALHSITERFSRWLLQSAQRAGSDSVQLTQELLSEMLGVRRTSVTEAALIMQKSGVIAYSRGVIKILKPDQLKTMSCECYQTLIDQSATLAPKTQSIDDAA